MVSREYWVIRNARVIRNTPRTVSNSSNSFESRGSTPSLQVGMFVTFRVPVPGFLHLDSTGCSTLRCEVDSLRKQQHNV